MTTHSALTRTRTAACTLQFVLAVTGLLQASGRATAQEADRIVVQGDTLHVTNMQRTIVGKGMTGPIEIVSAKSVVTYADLNLATRLGVSTLAQRITESAKRSCTEIKRSGGYGGIFLESDWSCVKTAVEGAKAQVREIVASENARLKTERRRGTTANAGGLTRLRGAAADVSEDK